MDEIELSIEEEQEILRIEEEEEDNDPSYEPAEDDDSSESEEDDNDRTKSTDVPVYSNNLQKWTDLHNVISVAGIVKKSRRYTEYMTEKLIARVMWKKKKFICRQGNVWVFRVDVYFHGIIRISALTSTTQMSPKPIAKRNHFHALYDELQVGKVYIFEKLSLKHADPRFDFYNNDYELSFRDGVSAVSEFEGGVTDFPTEIDYNPITIDKLNSIREPSCKQIIGVCTYSSPYDPQIGTRKITLVDDTDHEFSVTIDGEKARDFPNFVDGVSNPVVLIAGLKIRISVNGRIIITILRCSHFIVNVVSVRAALLVDWYFNSPHPVKFTRISRIEPAPFQRYPLAMRHFLDNKMTVVTKEIVLQFKIEEKSLTQYLITANIIPGPPVSCHWDGCRDEFGNGKYLVFDSREELYCHVVLDHYRTNDFVCHWNGCRRTLSQLYGWRWHICTEIMFWPFICEVCHRPAIKEDRFIQHIEQCKLQRPDDWKKLFQDKENEQEILIHPPQITTTNNTDSTVRYRKLLRREDTETFQSVCVEASCDKRSQDRTDYCRTHLGRNDNKWIVVAPFPLFYTQTEHKVTEGDNYHRREVLSKFTGQWNPVCAYQKCFRPFNQYAPPFCSTTCKNEYIRRRDTSLRQIQLNAIAAVTSGQVASSSSSNVQPPIPPPQNEIIVKNILDPTSDPSKRYIRHVNWRIDETGDQSVPLGFRRECLVQSCHRWGSTLICATHTRHAMDHDLKCKNDEESVCFIANRDAHQWSLGDCYWTRELFDNNKRGTKYQWGRLCWNWDCQALIGNLTLGFCSLPTCQAKKDLFPPIFSAAATTKRNRSKSDDRSNKKVSK